MRGIGELLHLGAILALLALAAAVVGSLTAWRPGLWALGCVLFICAAAVLTAAGLWALERVNPQKRRTP